MQCCLFGYLWSHASEVFEPANWPMSDHFNPQLLRWFLRPPLQISGFFHGPPLKRSWFFQDVWEPCCLFIKEGINTNRLNQYHVAHGELTLPSAPPIYRDEHQKGWSDETHMSTYGCTAAIPSGQMCQMFWVELQICPRSDSGVKLSGQDASKMCNSFSTGTKLWE